MRGQKPYLESNKNSKCNDNRPSFGGWLSSKKLMKGGKNAFKTEYKKLLATVSALFIP